MEMPAAPFVDFHVTLYEKVISKERWAAIKGKDGDAAAELLITTAIGKSNLHDKVQMRKDTAANEWGDYRRGTVKVRTDKAMAVTKTVPKRMWDNLVPSRAR